MSNSMNTLAASLASFFGFGTTPPSFGAFAFVAVGVGALAFAIAAFLASRGRGGFFGLFEGFFGERGFEGTGRFGTFFGLFRFFSIFARTLARFFSFVVVFFGRFAGFFGTFFQRFFAFFDRPPAFVPTGFCGVDSPVQGGNEVPSSPFQSRRTPGHSAR